MLALPRRTWTPERTAEAVSVLTAALRTPAGTMTLKPVQAIALAELGAYGGGFFPIGVGEGKTLLSLLAFTVLGASRPLLIVPANLTGKNGKTEAAAAELRRHWQIPTPGRLRIMAFELISHPNHWAALLRYLPDVIGVDECHRLKDSHAAVTKRVFRYLNGNAPIPKGAADSERAAIETANEAGRACKFFAESGTITSRSLKDYAHIVGRCLGPQAAPVPCRPTELDEWAEALDERPGLDGRIEPGALALLQGPQEAGLEPIEAARRAYRRRLVDTPGVVATTESALGCSLRIGVLRPKLPPNLLEAMRVVRDAWLLPDGTELLDGLRAAEAIHQLATGFYYRWDPWPPRPWLDARKAWASACRHILTTNRRALDSEKIVTDAIVAGLYPEAEEALAAWLTVEPTFKQTTVPVWIDDGIVDAAAEWAASNEGIVWTARRAFAERLRARTGLPYYGRQGCDTDGNPIPELGNPACGKGTVIASLANRTGRNLQGWSKALVTAMPRNGEWWEQLLGRLHRPGQRADNVSYEVFVTCEEHVRALDQVMADARYVEQSTGQVQKLSYADVEDYEL